MESGNIFDEIQNEVELFFHGLNWTYIFIYTITLYGIKNKPEFNWYNKLARKFDLNDFKIHIVGIFLMITFTFFRWQEGNILNSEYFSQLLRSGLIVIVFNSIFDKKIKEIDK